MIDPRVIFLCHEFGVEIIPGNRYPEVGQTRAPDTLRRIIDRYGIEHARLVMTTITQAGNNKLLLDKEGLWMVSDMVLKCRSLIEREAGAWLDTWDIIPGGELQFVAQELRGFVPTRFALGGMVYERLFRRFGPNSDQLDMLDDRRRMQ
ncbi:hypothetical protein SAMN05216176_11785 [Nitratireductor indicus]|uniref:hypothetical protein n=1 Tax=Nitratireductor indicus TaxID=721133 RepID=UPI0008E83E8A|nr:hypothetical protein [Nitratireductor indicus]SFQ80206.1 hypothetical protein SAMN05216176_11785 [Nitratireductor indicus]